MIRLIISDKSGQQTNFDFNKTEITIGRMKGNDIVLPKGNVSKKHATIYTQGGQFFLNDNNSTNGSYINGQRITGTITLGGEDKIFIGDFVIQVEGAVNAAQPPLPPTHPVTGPNNGLPPLPIGDTLDGDRQGFEKLWEGADADAQNPRSTFVSPPDDMSDLRQTMSNIPMDAMDVADSSPSQTPPLPPQDFQKPAFQQPDTPVPTAIPTAVPIAPPTPPQTGGGNIAHSSKPNLPTINPTAFIPEQPELISAFDADFFVGQLDAFANLLAQKPLSEWPRDYPASEEVKEEFSALIDTAIEAVEEDIDKAQLKDVLLAETCGLGVIDKYLEDDDVREFFVNQYDQIFLRDAGTLVQAPLVFSTPDVLQLVAERLLGEDANLLGADELRFRDGTRVHVMMPPLAVGGPFITVRKPSNHHPSLTDLIEKGVLSPGMGDFLMRAVDASQSVLICGPTASGKTTLLSCLGNLIHDGVRVVAVEDHSQMNLPQASAVRLEANPHAGFDKRFLLRSSLAMHPERILLDECKGSEAYEWVTSVATGTEGSMTTLHGINAHDALGRLESLCYLGAEHVSPRGLREQISRAVNIVVVVNRGKNSAFHIQQIAVVNGVDFDTYRLHDVFYHRVDGTDGFHPTGYIPTFYEDLQNAGIDVDFDIFRE